jgi:hypothetical protein
MFQILYNDKKDEEQSRPLQLIKYQVTEGTVPTMITYKVAKNGIYR